MAEGVQVSDWQGAGQRLYAEGDYAGAAVQFRQWAEAVPNSADAWRLLGFALYSSGSLEEAVSSFSKAVTLDPDMAEGHFGLGMAQVALNDLEHGIESLDEALRVKPDHAYAKGALVPALVERGRRHQAEGQTTYAEHDFDRATKLDRKSVEPVRAFVKFYVDTGQIQRAQKVLQQALIDHPGDPVIQDMAQRMNVRADEAAVTEAQKRQQIQQSQQVPCPVCKKMVMNWAVTCPYCQSTIKDTSQFRGRDAGPSTTWQEVAYKIMAVIWILWGASSIYAGIMWRLSGKYPEGTEALPIIVGAAEAGIGIGLLTESEVMQFIARIVCFLMFGAIGYGFLMGMMVNRWFLPIALGQIALASFQIYLIKEVGGD